MAERIIRMFVSAVSHSFLLSTCIAGIAAASLEETLMGYAVKWGKGFMIEADDEDYIVKGKNVSTLVGKLVEVTGIITESDKGDTIEVKSIEDVQDTLLYNYHTFAFLLHLLLSPVASRRSFSC